MITMSCILLSFSSEKDYFYSSTITSSSIYQNNKDIFDQLANEIKADSASYINLQAYTGESENSNLVKKEKITNENGKFNLYGVVYDVGTYKKEGQIVGTHTVYGITIMYEKRGVYPKNEVRFTGFNVGVAGVYDGARLKYMDMHYAQTGHGDNWDIEEKNVSYVSAERSFDKGWVTDGLFVSNFGVSVTVYYTRGRDTTLKNMVFQLNYRE